MSEPIIEYRYEFNVMDFVSKYSERVSRVIDEQTLANVEHQLAGYGYVKVVRCRDCRFCGKGMWGTETFLVCRRGMHTFQVTRDGFCKWGEKREG